MSLRNAEVAQLLEGIAELLEVTGGDPFRIRAYQQAARTKDAMSEDITELARGRRLEDIPGVGESIAAKVTEYLSTGQCAYYEELKRRAPARTAVELLEVPGIGPARVKVLTAQLGITSVAQLAAAARAERLRTLPGFGAKLEERIAREAGRVAERTRRMPLGVALPAAEEVMALLRRHPDVQAVEAGGSIRRMKETIGDIDLLVATDQPDRVAEAFTTLPIAKEVLMKGAARCSILTRGDLQIDLRLITPRLFGSALQYFTGSKDHNIALRTLAIARGWKLSEYGLFDERGQRIAGRTEEEIYHALGLECMPPELRENRGELRAAAQHHLPHLITERDLRGDLHVHTDWSDGHDSLERMVEAAIARGYSYIAITDHSPSTRVAHGLSIERVQKQQQLIARLNERYAPFRVLHGAEVDIRPDGTLDYAEDVLAALDLVSISVHSAFDQSRETMTARILRALSNPRVRILNHPTGRLLLQREPYAVDLEAVIRAAVAGRIALEINGQPERLDLDDEWARRAEAAGAMLVCDSDAHSAGQLDFTRYAVAVARRGWVETPHVLNAHPLESLLRFLRRRKPLAQPA
jgi:DNA polymerase (family 10)